MDIGRFRLASQRIGGSTLRNAAEVVEWMGAVQAQDYPASLWAIGLRMQHSSEPAVEQAIAGRRIVRTWPMRGTLHFVPAQDARWMLALLTPRVIRGSAARYRQLELDDAVFTRSRKLVIDALRGGNVLTRPALQNVLERAGISTADSRGLHILGYLAQQSVVCFGPRAGKQHTFVLFDEWITHSRDLTGDEAMAELARRYFTSHGPATLHDFAWWSGLTITEAKRAVSSTADLLTSEQFNDRTYWLAPSASPARSTSAHLLPAYDEFTVAYRERRDVLAAEHAARASAGGILYPTILAGSRIIGTWRRTLIKADIAVTLQPFEQLKRTQLPLINAAAKRYAGFLNRTLAGTEVQTD